MAGRGSIAHARGRDEEGRSVGKHTGQVSAGRGGCGLGRVRSLLLEEEEAVTWA